MATTQGIELLKKTAVQSFWNRYTTEPDVWEGLLDVRQSTQETDTLPRFGSAPMPAAMIGDLEYKAANEYSYSITNNRYRAGLRIGAKTLKFEQWAEVANLVGNMGAKARLHPQKLATTLIEAGAAATTEDGQFFYDVDHSDPGAEYTTSQDNGGTGGLLTENIATPAAPTDLNVATAIRGMIDQFYSFKDDRGDPFTVEPIGPENLVIMAAPTHATMVRRVLKASDLTGPIGNDLMDTFELRVNRRIAATTTLYAFIKSSTHKPVVMQQAGGVELYDHFDQKSGDYFFGVEWWGAVDYGNWRTSCAWIWT
jgi:hypothetical protein